MDCPPVSPGGGSEVPEALLELRESIVTNYNKYKQKRYCPIFAKESLKKVYASYAALGGNDVATGLYKELLEMPTEKEA